jgi:diguanylate cyclase (GGDEF)-like protein
MTLAGLLRARLDSALETWRRAMAKAGSSDGLPGGAEALLAMCEWLERGDGERLRQIARSRPFGDGEHVRPGAVEAALALETALRSVLAAAADNEDEIRVLMAALGGAISGELASNEMRLRELSAIDDLTGAMSRRAVMDALDSEIARAVRHGRQLSIVYLDVDLLKQVNDQSGHPAGDRLLAEVASVVRKACRASDLLGRIGGDEFLLVLPDTPVDGAETVAERLARRAADAGGSVSVGTAGSPRDRLDRDTLIEAADSALRQAKRGRGRAAS